MTEKNIGIDFGTTNTVIYSRDAKGKLKKIGGKSIKSAIYFLSKDEYVIGSEALDHENESEHSRALITDYSSVSWDVHYLKKPVLFFQFDLARYLEDPGSLVDLEKELFGERFVDTQSLIRGIASLAERGFSELPEYARGRKDRFAYTDRENCARTLRFLKQQGF